MKKCNHKEQYLNVYLLRSAFLNADDKTDALKVMFWLTRLRAVHKLCYSRDLSEFIILLVITHCSCHTEWLEYFSWAETVLKWNSVQYTLSMPNAWEADIPFVKEIHCNEIFIVSNHYLFLFFVCSCRDARRVSKGKGYWEDAHKWNGRLSRFYSFHLS